MQKNLGRCTARRTSTTQRASLDGRLRCRRPHPDPGALSQHTPWWPLADRFTCLAFVGHRKGVLTRQLVEQAALVVVVFTNDRDDGFAVIEQSFQPRYIVGAIPQNRNGDRMLFAPRFRQTPPTP